MPAGDAGDGGKAASHDCEVRPAAALGAAECRAFPLAVNNASVTPQSA
jgi:hypothetical protein